MKMSCKSQLKRRALQLDGGDLLLDDMNGHETLELLALAKPIEKDLMCCCLCSLRT